MRNDRENNGGLTPPQSPREPGNYAGQPGAEVVPFNLDERLAGIVDNQVAAEEEVIDLEELINGAARRSRSS